MAYDARSVANEFLRIARDSGRTLTNMQIQKLVYIAHGYALAILKKGLIKQDVVAWRYGPVINDLYHALRQYGAGIVTEPITTLPQDRLSETDRALIASVAGAYCRFTGPQLSTMTHKVGTPWHKVYDANSLWNNQVIPDPLIQEYYLNLLNERDGIRAA